MKVAFVTPELQSLVRRTNLAEVAENLPKTLRQANVDARVFLPFTLDVRTEAISELRETCQVRVRDVDGWERVVLHTGRVDDLPVVLFDHPVHFRDRHPYGDDEGPYPDNWRRYALFARAVLESLPLLQFQPDILHCMDWTTGLIPLIRELEFLHERPDHPASKAGIYFAIHNLAMQGAFEREILPRIGLPHSVFHGARGIELHGKVNFLKAGAEYSTVIGTHSPSHAQRIQEIDRGYGLEETFRRRAKELVGISNGIDYKAWDPASDPILPEPFSADDKDLAGKRKCKSSLQGLLGLEVKPRVPLLALIGRFDADSGFDLVAEVLTELLERNVEIVLMGSGRPEILERVTTMESTFKGRCRLIQGYDVHAAHRILAGADVIVLPSHYHPTNALCAIGMRYGVVPLVYARSGLEDTVVDVAEDAEKGTGFFFHQYTGEGLVEGLDEARKAYRDAAGWKEIVGRCLAQDFSWQNTSREYLKAYRRVTRRVRGRKS